MAKRAGVWMFGVALLHGSGACAGADLLADMRVSREGVLYRVDAATPEAAKPAYRILEREADPDMAAALERASAQLAINGPMPMRDLAVVLLKEHALAVRFSGKAVNQAMTPVGPVVVSGSLLGALRNLASQAGLQLVIHRDAVEFADRKSFALLLPNFENPTEVATRMMGTGASNIKLAGGSVSFDADADALRAVQHLLRELRLSRRGVTSFLSEVAGKQPGGATKAGPDAETRLANAEQGLMRQMGITSPPAKPMEPAPAPARPSGPDPLQVASISLVFKGDVVQALEKIGAAAKVEVRVVEAPAKPVSVNLKLRAVPLQLALETVGAQTRNKADIVYDKQARRIDIRAR